MGLRLLKCSLVVLLIGVMPLSLHANEHFPFVGKINSDDINVRAGASTNYERIDQLATGTLVIVKSKLYDWYNIQLLPSAHVFMRADYLKPIAEGKSQVIGERVNVRARPNSEASALGQLDKDTVINYREISNNWVDIIPPVGITGWVNYKFVEPQVNINVEEYQAKLVTDEARQVVEKPIVPVIEKPVSEPKIQKIMTVELEGIIKKNLNLQTGSGESVYEFYLKNEPVYQLNGIPNGDLFDTHKVRIKGTVDDKQSTGSLPQVEVSSVNLML